MLYLLRISEHWIGVRRLRSQTNRPTYECQQTQQRGNPLRAKLLYLPRDTQPLSQCPTSLAPSAPEVTKICGVRHVNFSYALATWRRNSPTASARTRLIVQPPKPPPVIRAPNTPGKFSASSTIRSSSAQLT